MKQDANQEQTRPTKRIITDVFKGMGKSLSISKGQAASVAVMALLKSFEEENIEHEERSQRLTLLVEAFDSRTNKKLEQLSAIKDELTKCFQRFEFDNSDVGNFEREKLQAQIATCESQQAVIIDCWNGAQDDAEVAFNNRVQEEQNGDCMKERDNRDDNDTKRPERAH